MSISGPHRRNLDEPKRPPRTEAAASRSSSASKPGRAAVGQPSSPEAGTVHCPNCPAKVQSANKQPDNRVRRQCCGRYLFRSYAAQAIERTYRDASGLILMCMYCNRTRRSGTSDRWDWVEPYTVQMPAGVTHGICQQCLRTALAATYSGR